MRNVFRDALLQLTNTIQKFGDKWSFRWLNQRNTKNNAFNVRQNHKKKQRNEKKEMKSEYKYKYV